MKNIIVTTFTLLIIGMFLTIHPAFAGDRVKVYEMVESGLDKDLNSMRWRKAGRPFPFP